MRALVQRVTWEWQMVRHSWVHYQMSRMFYREIKATSKPTPALRAQASR